LEDIRAEKFAKRSAYLLAQQQRHQEYSGFMADDEQQSFSDKQCSICYREACPPFTQEEQFCFDKTALDLQATKVGHL
jgi:hypothetical protein